MLRPIPPETMRSFAKELNRRVREAEAITREANRGFASEVGLIFRKLSRP